MGRGVVRHPAEPVVQRHLRATRWKGKAILNKPGVAEKFLGGWLISLKIVKAVDCAGSSGVRLVID